MLAHSIVKVNDNKLHKALSYITSNSHDIAYALEITEILLTIYPNNNTVIAGLLSTAISTTDLSNITLHLQEITCQFGTEIANIVEGILKASTIHYLPYNARQAQRFFDYLLSMPEEVAVGVLLVKLTHLLHNISIFSVSPALEKYAISALEIMEIYVPLLSRIGLEEIKIELQEICLTILQPDIREYILTHLHAFCGKDIKALINKIINSLHNSLQAEGIQAKIFGRIKTPYSIWLKMLQKNINIGQLYDILAFRIIVENVEDCYKALAVIHTRYQNVKGQFQDYIRQPKSNGYQSLHTIIIGPTKKNIEIQIRTCAMNEKAQHGAAAHWQYKKKPTIIKERVYNIYQSLYQAAYLPIMNIFKTSIKERDIKQHIHKLYKFELYKELGIVRNINSRLLFNNNLANICQNNSNTVLALLEPNINLDFNHMLLRANNCNAHLNTDSLPAQAIAQLMNKLTIHTDQKLLLDTLPIGLYISDDSNMIFASCHSAQLAMKIEPLKFQTQSTNPQTTLPLLMDPFTKNKQHHNIKKATLINQQARHESSDHDAIGGLPLSAPLTMIIRQTLGSDGQALDNHAMSPPNENVYTPLIQAVISNNKKQVVEMLQDQELNPNEGSTFIPAGRTSSDIWPAFLLAVYMREEEIVRAFLSHPKVDVIQQNPDFETVLIVAAQTSNIRVFQLLVNYFKANWQEIFERDIGQFREYINWRDSNDCSALYYAIYNYFSGATDSPVIVRTLLEWKDDKQTHLISDTEQLRFTIMALRALGIVCYTLEEEYNRNEEQWGYCPHGLIESYIENPDNLYQLLEKFRIIREIINLVRSSSGTSNLESDPYLQSSSDVQRSLYINFTNIININATDQQGHSLLVKAILDQDVNTVKCLLQFPEININQINPIPTIRGIRDDDQPFLLAVHMGNLEIIQALLAHPETNITVTNQNEDTALILATQSSNVEMLQLLVNHFNANWQEIFENDMEQFKEYVNWRDSNNCSALSHATQNYLMGYTDNHTIIEILLAWRNTQQELLVSDIEQKEFWRDLLELDEGYESVEDLNLLEENTPLYFQKLYTLIQIAVEKWGISNANWIYCNVINQIVAKEFMYPERDAREIAKYPLIDTFHEEGRIKNIGDSYNYPAWD